MNNITLSTRIFDPERLELYQVTGIDLTLTGEDGKNKMNALVYMNEVFSGRTKRQQALYIRDMLNEGGYLIGTRVHFTSLHIANDIFTGIINGKGLMVFNLDQQARYTTALKLANLELDAWLFKCKATAPDMWDDADISLTLRYLIKLIDDYIFDSVITPVTE